MGYMILFQIKNASLVLANGPDTIEISKQAFDAYHNGLVFIPWKDFLSYGKTITPGNYQNEVLTLKMHLKRIGHSGAELTPYYDEYTQDVVKRIQRNYGLEDDGVVGPLTKIALYNQSHPSRIPLLNTPTNSGL